LKRGDAEQVLTVLERWYRIEGKYPRISPDSAIILAPFHSIGYVGIAGSVPFQMKMNSQQVLEALALSANRFCGTSISVTGGDNSNLNVPQRFGVPDQEQGAAYEAAVGHAYCPEAIVNELTRLALDCSAQLFLGAKPHPIQAIQLQRMGRTWPIVASLERPLPDRPPRRVAVWSGAGSMTESMEVEAVRSVFHRRGVAVEVHAPGTTSVGDFLNVYKNPEFDVFWVISHGEYDHWAPKNVSVQIGHSQNFIRLDDLLGEAPQSEMRRLLVLNVCDGARFEEIGALPRIGFGPALAGANQAVVSHLWPVRGLPAAAFGALLATQLAVGVPFFAAFSSALTAVRAPRDKLVGKLVDAVGRMELTERVAQSGESFENFGACGSATFYQ
jgi:hypothetical protein